MEEVMNLVNKNDDNSSAAGSTLLPVSVAAYFLYALFVLVECLDFSALLRFPEPGYHATYDMTHVIFYVLELIICITFGVILMVINFAKDKKPYTVVLTIIMITILRACLIYYLYMFKEGSYQITPFIYKKANDLSGLVRTIMLPLQVLAGIGCAWRWIRIARKQPDSL